MYRQKKYSTKRPGRRCSPKRSDKKHYKICQLCKQNQKNIWCHIQKSNSKISPKTWKNEVWRWSGSSWGRGKKSLKGCPDRFWSILAGLGSAKISPNWAKMGPSWSQDGAKIPQVGAKMAILRPSWGQDGHLEAIWGAFLSIFGGLGSDL